MIERNHQGGDYIFRNLSNGNFAILCTWNRLDEVHGPAMARPRTRIKWRSNATVARITSSLVYFHSEVRWPAERSKVEKVALSRDDARSSRSPRPVATVLPVSQSPRFLRRPLTVRTIELYSPLFRKFTFPTGVALYVTVKKPKLKFFRCVHVIFNKQPKLEIFQMYSRKFLINNQN